MSFIAKDARLQDRQNLVQELCIPFTLTASATAANVVLANDEPSRMFLKSAGVDQITGALATNETATYANAPNDASGILNVLLNINEPLLKVISASVGHRDKVAQSSQGAFLGDAAVTGITTGTGGGQKIMLQITTGVNHTTTNVNAALTVKYATTF